MKDVERAYDEVAALYDDHHVDAKSLAENRYVARYLRSTIRSSDSIADLGCGTGLLLDLVSIDPARYVGVDISNGMLARAARKYPRHRFIHGDVEERVPELADRSIDYVISLFGAASYCSLDSFAAEMNRILKPDGRYFVMFCGPPYRKRPTYINRAASLLNCYRAEEIQRAFQPQRMWGMSRIVDYLPSWTPAWAMDAALAGESKTLGGAWQNACFFINISGRAKR